MATRPGVYNRLRLQQRTLQTRRVLHPLAVAAEGLGKFRVFRPRDVHAVVYARLHCGALRVEGVVQALHCGVAGVVEHHDQDGQAAFPRHAQALCYWVVEE